MPPLYNRCRMVLTPMNFVNSRQAAERQTREVLRRAMERFWFPFTSSSVYQSHNNSSMHQKTITGSDSIATYRFKENFDTIRAADPHFSCQLNGAIGGAKIMEDFFITLLCGFDIVNVSIDSNTSSASNPFNGGSVASVRGGSNALTDLCLLKGSFTIAHTRPFLGWSPNYEYRSTVDAEGATNNNNNNNNKNAKGDTANTISDCFTDYEKPPLPAMVPAAAPAPRKAPLITVPFTAHVEAGLSSKLISHMVFRTPLLDYMTNTNSPTAAMFSSATAYTSNVEYLAQCPTEVQACLRNPEAMRMLVALRRAQVSPSLIKAPTLMSATRKESTWARAMGLM